MRRADSLSAAVGAGLARRAGAASPASARFLAAVVSLFFCGPLLAAAPPAQKKLHEIESALEQGRVHQAEVEREAETLGAEIAKLRIESVAAARAAQDHEAAIAALEDQLDELAAQERAKVAELDRRQRQHEQLMMALQRLARHPPEALALSAADPLDAVRSGMLLSAALPQIEAQAKALEAELSALAGLRERIGAKRQEMAARSEALGREEQRMGELIRRKAALQARIAQKVEIGAQRLAQLSTQAGDLRELIERLEAERKRREAEERAHQAELLARAMARPPRPDPPAEKLETPEEPAAAASAPLAPARVDPGRPKTVRSIAAAKGAMVLPVSGRLFRKYGEPDDAGMSSKGLVLQTRPGAPVVAPWDGRIEFAGPFRGYGQILIIEHGDGYHSLLAGLERIDGAVGQWLVAGEPVGAMKPGEAKPMLYLELRRNGQPINPLPWLATRDEKVSG